MQGHERQICLSSEEYPLPGVLAAAALLPRSPGLPEGVWRNECLETVITACNRQLTPAAREVLRFYARCTRPADWSAPGRGPVAYVAQRTAAEALNLTRRTIYNAECDLEQLGLIIKQVADNGRRYGPQGSDGEVCGIYFAPMIASYEVVLAAAAAAAAGRDRLVSARKLASGLRFRLRKLISQAGDRPEAHAALEALNATPTGIMALTNPEVLDGITTLLAPHIKALSDLGHTKPNSVENTEKQPKISHAWEIDFSYHKYITTKSSYVNSISDKEIRTTSHEAEDNFNLTAANAAELLRKKNGEEAEAVKNPNNNSGGNVGKGKETGGDWNETGIADPVAQSAARQEKKALAGPEKKSPSKVIWTMAQLYAAASAEFRALLDLERDSTGQIDNRSFVDTAETICHMLGINPAAWRDACAVMGRNETALAILVIDRNRTHPTHPVHSPRGAIRAMTERAKQGELRIDASVFAILNRAKNAKQH